MYACANLHNFLITNRFNINRDIDEDIMQKILLQNNGHIVNVQANLPVGRARRNKVVNYLNTQLWIGQIVSNLCDEKMQKQENNAYCLFCEFYWHSD